MTEIGHIVAEYEHSIVTLLETFEDDDLESLSVRLEDWVVYTYTVTLKKIKHMHAVLIDAFDAYIPEDDDDEFDDEDEVDA